MVDNVLLYISAASDLEIERDLLGRGVAEIPVTLGWRIFQSPLRGERLEIEAIIEADIHLLLLASDIRAPIGYELAVSRHADRKPVFLLKKDALRTPAASAFLRSVQVFADWQTFHDNDDLIQQVQKLLAEHILEQAIRYALRPAEFERLSAWRAELDSRVKQREESQGVAGLSAVILSPERYTPTDGVLIQPISKTEKKT